MISLAMSLVGATRKMGEMLISFLLSLSNLTYGANLSATRLASLRYFSNLPKISTALGIKMPTFVTETREVRLYVKDQMGSLKPLELQL